MTRNALFMTISSEPARMANPFYFCAMTSLTILNIGVKSWYSGFARKVFSQSARQFD